MKTTMIRFGMMTALVAVSVFVFAGRGVSEKRRVPYQITTGEAVSQIHRDIEMLNQSIEMLSRAVIALDNRLRDLEDRDLMQNLLVEELKSQEKFEDIE